MKMSKRILFFGNERLATGVTTNLPILKALLAAGFDIACIVITAQPASVSRKPRMLEVSQFATDNRIPLLAVDKLKDSLDQLRNYRADAAVLAAFGKIVPQQIIDIFPAGIINIHPSLLPKHRGPTPIESPILQGEKQTGISLMKLVKEMDAGPIYDQIRIDLKADQTKQELADILGEAGAKRLVTLLPDIIEGRLEPKKQEDRDATYDNKIGPNDGLLDFSRPAMELERQIRAYSGWPRSKTTINDQPIVITKAHVIDTDSSLEAGKVWKDDNLFGFVTPKGILAIDRLIPAGSKEMTAADYLRGHAV